MKGFIEGFFDAIKICLTILCSFMVIAILASLFSC